MFSNILGKKKFRGFKSGELAGHNTGPTLLYLRNHYFADPCLRRLFVYISPYLFKYFTLFLIPCIIAVHSPQHLHVLAPNNKSDRVGIWYRFKSTVSSQNSLFRINCKHRHCKPLGYTSPGIFENISLWYSCK